MIGSQHQTEVHAPNMKYGNELKQKKLQMIEKERKSIVDK